MAAHSRATCQQLFTPIIDIFFSIFVSRLVGRGTEYDEGTRIILPGTTGGSGVVAQQFCSVPQSSRWWFTPKGVSDMP